MRTPCGLSVTLVEKFYVEISLLGVYGSLESERIHGERSTSPFDCWVVVLRTSALTSQQTGQGRYAKHGQHHRFLHLNDVCVVFQTPEDWMLSDSSSILSSERHNRTKSRSIFPFLSRKCYMHMATYQNVVSKTFIKLGNPDVFTLHWQHLWLVVIWPPMGPYTKWPSGLLHSFTHIEAVHFKSDIYNTCVKIWVVKAHAEQ